MNDLKDHWDKIYYSRTPDEMSWTQGYPDISMKLLKLSGVTKTAKIIDIGGGNGTFVSHLLKKGFQNLTVVDISKEAIEKTKTLLGPLADKIEWIVSDILDFVPTKSYDYWHDRATFHFLTEQNEVDRYIEIVNKAISLSGFLSIGTFSTAGPTKCSGLEIKQYSEKTLTATLNDNFEKVKCLTEDHLTPKKSVQNFLFCLLKCKR